MAGDEPQDFGVRRRRSAHSGEDFDVGGHDASDHAARAGSSHNDGRRRSSEVAARVRFSADVERNLKSKKRKSDELAKSIDGTDDSSKPLRLDTQPGRGFHVENIMGEETVKSPTNTVSPVSPIVSPRTRTRGMSLRSSLFLRSMNQKASHNSPVELQEFGPSSSTANTRPSSRKKGSQATVTVSPVIEERDVSPTSQARKAQLPAASGLPNYQQWVEKHARRHLPLKGIEDAFDKARKFVLRIQEIPPSKDGRQILLDPSRKKALIDERTSKPFISNMIRSSKYTPWNFVPRQAWAQFSKLANFYFLCVSILQMIPGLSTTGTYTTIIPLLFFVSISMAKEGYEDLRRHRLDKAENNREANVLHAYKPVQANESDLEQAAVQDGPTHWATTKWHSVEVGDIIKVNRDEAIPADVILLGSKGPNNVAYIETMALDGETNLKNKQPVAATARVADSAESLAAARMHFVVEDPNLDLYNFEGKVTIDGETIPLTSHEIIYRGSILRNTPEAFGIVIYSGEECKIRMNANKNPRIKAPSLQAIVNKIVVVIVCFVAFLALFNTIAYQIWKESTEESAFYLSSAHVPFGQILVSFVIMFNTMIPLSLYVSMEIIKLAQLYLLDDIDMYDAESNTPFEARTSTINEELGQVNFLFSDKTGTLTENVMRFRKLSVAGTAWLHDVDLAKVDETNFLLHKKRKPRNKGKNPIRRKSHQHDAVLAQLTAEKPNENHDTDGLPLPRASTASQWKSSAMPSMPQTESSTRYLIHHIQRRPQSAFAQRAKMMILSMALCHTCLPERSEQSEGEEEQVTYQASSPDELALVEAAKELGFVAWERDSAVLTLKTFPHGQNAGPFFETYEILDVIEFSSKRKRMSVVVRLSDGRIAVICKGADSMVMERLRLAALANQKQAEIEKRDIRRKSMEAEQALRRRSSQMEHHGSMSNHTRTTTSLARHSTTIGRPSIGRLPAIRDEVDGWLNEREHDVDTTPRPSTNTPARPSMAPSEYPGSLYSEFGEGIPDDSTVLDDSLLIETTFQHINSFATEGLRTLLYGFRFLEDDEYRAWKKVYHDATTSLVDRQILIERAGELIEQRLELAGATAIEDKLQKGVPETIERLRRGNIKIWMLTGDKRETAINIGHSCRLIKDYSALTVLDCEAGEVEQNIASALVDINRGELAHSVVVIDGQTLGAIEADASLHILFLDLAILVDSVICCRASPSQKAGLVSAVRRRVNRSVTLAIGDGANDIAMIQEAHVGIGITGKEGLQAARTSDYAIAQFRFLAKLLLVHGRWNYVRTCKYTVGTFWKEMLFYLTQALYQRSNGYTGTSLYEQWSLSMFNTLFTSLVVIFLGVFEQDLRASTLIAVPELYTKGQRSAGFNLKVYLGWMFMAASEAVIIYFTMHGLYGQAKFSIDNSIFPMGDMTFTACVIVIAVKLQLIEQRNKSVMALIAVVLSVGGWFLFNIILAALYQKNNEYGVKDGLFQRFGRSGLWWLTLILIVSAVCLFELGVRALKATFFPTDVETFQALEQDLSVRKRFEEASAEWMQAGWHRGSKKTSLELQRDAEEQARREGEVQELLARPRVMEEGLSSARPVDVEREEQAVFVEDGPGRGSVEIQEMLSRRFGNVRNGSLSRT